MSATNPIVGEYENFEYGPPEKNHYHYVTILEDGKGGFIWRNPCVEWSLTPIKDEKLKFDVGDKCPYFEGGHKIMKFKTDYKGNIVGAFGPHNEYYTKVEQHSSIKYNLKGMKKPNDSNDVDMKQEGMETSQTLNDEKQEESISPFTWKGGKCSKNNCIGRVSIDENFVVEFAMQVHGKACSEWESILHIGNANMQRSPGFWLHPKSYKLHVRLSDTKSDNTGYDPNMELEKGGIYHIKFECVNNNVKLFINDQLQQFAANVHHIARYKCPVFVGDPWYTSADVTISELKIYNPK